MGKGLVFFKCLQEFCVTEMRTFAFMNKTFVTQKYLQVDAWKNSMSAFTDMDNIRVSLLLSHLYSF